MSVFPSLSSVGPIPLLAFPAGGLVLLLVASLVALWWYRRQLVAFADTPEFQIQQLAKKTSDYGVAYAEINFGKLIGKGSQGEVFLAQWRGIDVAVKKVDTSIVPPEIIDEFCFPVDDHQLLTDRGFLSFDEVCRALPHLAPGAPKASSERPTHDQPLLFASFNPATQAMEYLPATAIIVKHTDTLIDFVQSGEARRWTADSDQFGRTRKAASHSDRSFDADERTSTPDEDHLTNGVALSVTPGHRMYALSGHRVSATGPEVNWSSHWAADEQMPGGRKRVRDDFSLQPAESLLSEDPLHAVKFLAAAPSGLAIQKRGCDDDLPFLHALRLTPADIHIFLELYGYWLADGGSLDLDVPRSVTFRPKHMHSQDWVVARLSALRLLEDTDWSRMETADRPACVRLTNEWWVQYFSSEYDRGQTGDHTRLSSEATAAGDASHGCAERQLASNVIAAKWFWSWHRRLNKEQLRSMVRGLRRVDGDVAAMANEEGGLICTKSVHFRDDLMVVLLHAGYAAKFDLMHPTRESDDAPTAQRAHWRVSFHDSPPFREPDLRQSEIVSRPFKGQVWCVRVPPHNLIVARRAHVEHGVVTKASVPLVVGNCAEADIMRRLRHPCLTLFMGVSLEQPYLCIVTELVSRGSLFDILQEESTGFTWRRAIQIMTDIASGIAYLHSHSPPLLHRDLKSLNVLVTSNWRGKVADFGMSRFQSNPDEERTMTQCGSPLWMAPEMIKNESYDEKADVFSFGIVLWELYTRRVPYRELNLNPSNLVVKVVRDGLRPDIPKGCPKKFVALMKACWHKDPTKRPPFKDILKTLEGFATDTALLRHKPKRDDGLEDEEVEDETDQGGAGPGVAGGPGEETALSGHIASAARAQDELEAAAAALALEPDGWQIADLDHLELSRTRILGETEAAAAPAAAGVGPSKDSSSKHAHPSSHPYPHTVVESSSHPSRTSAKRAHLVYRAKYRGKNVVVKKCYITPPTPPPTENGGDAPLVDSKRGRPRGASPGDVSIPSDVTASDHAALGALLRRVASVRHPNLVLFMGAFLEYDHVGVVEEEVARGSLAHLLSSPTILEWDQSIQILLDTASAMACLESVNMVHPDLCTKRLLVTPQYRVKVSGYGFVSLDRKLAEMIQLRAIREGALPASTTPRIYESKVNLWSAPETFDQDEPVHLLTYSTEESKTMKSNVYSFGMVAWSVITRKLPYDGKFGPKLRQKIRDGFRLPLPNSVTPKFKSLIKSCWTGDLKRRPTFREIHAALQQIKLDGPPVVKLDETNSKVYRKAATVFAYASKDPITILKDTGKVRGSKMNILVVSSTKPSSAAAQPDEEYYNSFTDLYMYDPSVFARTYEPTGVHENEYRKVGSVRARKMEEPFAIRTGVTSGDTTAGAGLIEQGVAGDYVCQNEAGDQWIADGKTMEAVYSEVHTPGEGDQLPMSPSVDSLPFGSTQLFPGQASISQHAGADGVSIQLVGLGGGVVAAATSLGEPPTPVKVEATKATKPTPTKPTQEPSSASAPTTQPSAKPVQESKSASSSSTAMESSPPASAVDSPKKPKVKAKLVVKKTGAVADSSVIPHGHVTRGSN